MTDKFTVIKSCPFCGGSDIRYGQSEVGMRLNCMTCHATGPGVSYKLKGDNSKHTLNLRVEEAHRLWNERAGIV